MITLKIIDSFFGNVASYGLISATEANSFFLFYSTSTLDFNSLILDWCTNMIDDVQTSKNANGVGN